MSAVAWEWVAPVATATSGGLGIFFTWLSGSQGRKQVEAMARREAERTHIEVLLRERRDAYLAILRQARLGLQRAHYINIGEASKLAELDRKWPKADRVEARLDALSAVEVFGSPRVQSVVRRWYVALDLENEENLKKIYLEGLNLIREKLGLPLIDGDDQPLPLLGDAVGEQHLL